MKRIVSILLWSAISAAFIGPGTVTTAAASGAKFGYTLLYALLFSTIACLVLQEASARLTIVTGKPLARNLREQFGKGALGVFIPACVVGAVVFGCIAYQAGNIIGAKSGVALGLDWINPKWTILAIGVIAGVILFTGAPQLVAKILGVVVAMMGVAFLVCAFKVNPDFIGLLKGCVTPSFPAGAGMLTLGLIGTTVVPYNLFLGSGLAKGQTLGDARFGLAVAIPLGGIISMGILVVGTAVKGDFSFDALASALQIELGGWTRHLFAFGLFAAGLSSAITAPLAAALSVDGLMRGSYKKGRSRTIWLTVLLFGLLIGMLDLKPAPVIILAQALNGIILPAIAVFLWIAVNDRKTMGENDLCGPASNILLGISVLVAFVLGASYVLKAAFKTVNSSAPDEKVFLISGCALAAIISIPVIRMIRTKRSL